MSSIGRIERAIEVKAEPNKFITYVEHVLLRKGVPFDEADIFSSFKKIDSVFGFLSRFFDFDKLKLAEVNNPAISYFGREKQNGRDISLILPVTDPK